MGRIRPGIAPALHDVTRNGVHARVLGDLRQVRRRVIEGDLQRLIVQGPHAQRRLVEPARVHRLAVLQDIEQVGVGRCRPGIHDPAQGIDEVLRRQRRPVGPGRLAQMEGPDQAVRRSLPGFSHARDGRPVGRLLHQAHHQVADDRALGHQADLVGVERGRVVAVAVFQADLSHRARRTLHARAAAGQGQDGGQSEEGAPQALLTRRSAAAASGRDRTEPSSRRGALPSGGASRGSAAPPSRSACRGSPAACPRPWNRR